MKRIDREIIENMLLERLNRVAINLYDSLTFSHVTLPADRIEGAWQILEWNLKESGGFFSTWMDGWKCGFGDDDSDQFIHESAAVAICRAFIFHHAGILDEQGNLIPEENTDG